jgi:molybdenum cofactor synthesis domain-containing protein
LRDSVGFAPTSLQTHRPGICARRGEDSASPTLIRRWVAASRDTGRMVAALLTIGNEVVSGDVTNTNAAWLAQRLESLGVHVVLAAAVPDEIEQIAEFINRERVRVDVIVTGGLGGTPDDLTREAIAATFAVPQREVPELAAGLRERFPRHPDYAARWAQLPVGSRPLRNPKGGAPGFVIENVWALPGLPSEMEAMFDAYAEEFRGPKPISSWRRTFRTRESDIVHLLTGATVRWPQVAIGSYPRFDPDGPEVEIVLKSEDAKLLAQAVGWLEPELAAIAGA